MKSALRSASFSGRDSKPAILKFCSFGERIVKGSLSFKRNEWNLFPLEAKILIKRPSIEKENSVGSVSFKGLRYIDLNEGTQKSPGLNSGGSDHEVADCTLFTEQQWWILLDFALLERSSVSFFDINKPESAFSRWLRARKRAAKIGKGLSKDKNARKLAFQHRLEAIDPHHRYGHNLEFYFKYWLGCETKQPFFYWLDLGEGKEVNLEQECPRLKLQQQCIKYLGPKESEAYEVIVENGKFFYKQSRQLLHTSEGPKDSKWIFVLSTSKALYVGQKKKGTFQHSSFLAGGATSAAGRLVVENGILKAVWPHSGHYCPKEENFQEFESFLKENNVDLTDVKKGPIGVDEEAWSNSIGIRFTRKVSFELNFTRGNISTEHESKIETSHACDGMPSNIAIAKMTNSFEETGGVRFSSSSTETKLAGKRKLKESLLLKQNYTPQKRNMLEDHEDSEEVNGRTNCIAEPKEADSFQSPEGPSCGNSAEVQLGGNEKLEQICTSDGYQIFENEICLRSGKRIKRHSYHKN